MSGKRQVKRDSPDHPDVHVVAGCVVTGTEPDGCESVERVVEGQPPMFWGHYRVTEYGRQLWLADYDDRDAALGAAKAQAGRGPIYLEENRILILVSGTASTRHPA